MAILPERVRPYLAALLGTVATGFGHFYLRRWLRGLGWVALAFVVTVAFVPQQSMTAITAGETLSDQTDLYPTMMIQLVGALDAFLLAYRGESDESPATGTAGPVTADTTTADAATTDAAMAGSATTDATTAGSATTDAAPDTIACPNCGKEVDAELGFCHWCTTEFVPPEE